MRAVACEVLAKQIIEAEEDQAWLLQNLLLQRFSILVDGEPTEPANAVERAVDLHALRVIGSSGYQKCTKYLWRGWLVQDDQYPSNFIPWTNKANTTYWDHFDPDRMRAPQYQNAVQIFMSLLYLALYTGAINTINYTGDLDVVEGILYLMTAGFVFDEISKFWKIGWNYLGFWNVFNVCLYSLLTVSFVLRMIALGHPLDDGDGRRGHFNELSYNFLAFSAPMFWMRLLLYLDNIRFFGAMLVVLKVMMKESLIFFALLIIICVGFLQAFIGMDQIDDNAKVTSFIIQAMANSVMQSPDFDGFEKFAPPFGIILYYIFTFVVMVGMFRSWILLPQLRPHAPFLSYFLHNSFLVSHIDVSFMSTSISQHPSSSKLTTIISPSQHPHRPLQLRLRRHHRQRHRRVHGPLLPKNPPIRPRPRRERLHRPLQPHRTLLSHPSPGMVAPHPALRATEQLRHGRHLQPPTPHHELAGDQGGMGGAPQSQEGGE